MPLLYDATAVAFAQRFAVGVVIAAAIAWMGYRTRSLTLSGSLMAVIVGALTFSFGGPLVAAAVIIFFIAGSVLSRVHIPSADQARVLAPKGAQRDAAQVAANGGVATACAIVGGIAALYGSPHASRFMIAAVCAIAAASGDTWSTEIGALARGPARLITNMKVVDAGTSGGVTILGIVAAPFGGAIVGLAGAARPDILVLPEWIAICAAAGLIGSVVDSLLGATMQGMWQCSKCAHTVEARVHIICGTPCTLIRGLSWLDNDGINGIMTLVGAAVGYALAGL
ncbi:MAG TPA: DUF92 domain-containing protein [Candidatus Acidoferrales bacterium]|nr:DUF92 domain-containing protein [Candidatus Acidoferrales bacterium]